MFSSFLPQQICLRRIPLVALTRYNATVVRPLSSSLRCYQSTKSQVDSIKKTQQNGNNFEIIYKFPYIRLAHALCRLKIYQTGLTGLAVPGAGYFVFLGSLDPGSFVAVVVINGLAFLMLYVMGEIFRRTVGHVYYDSRSNLVKVSHLTFWGGRKDVHIPSSDIVPLTDTSDNLADIYVRLLRYSQPKFSLFLWLRFGGIIDYQKFNSVFGDLHPEEQLKKLD
ncbi:transmembrane protein 186-like [Homarus americanus]|uniref:transmembrane protein 186-like n=1 Tax=Homarus americanus TaxID=6706 RepID=UPI001C436D51|nr:transmembrane protein 186-like [Homarus americanus]XP_042235748.1 transmembrane protein 186-like [Homarus americanus]XP_042235749.1 transmembrane protein 186-like [Homarus americanus]XP_042235750.1 transmembrane protein 186-like [Homarus americanus]